MRILTTRKGFTLIELLVVVAVIGVLSSIVLSSLSKARARARDARRLADMRTIHQALILYEIDHGSLPRTYTYGESNDGGFDNSIQGDFLSFLVDGGYLGSVPVDPINTSPLSNKSALNSSATYLYRYYCYPSTSSAPGLRLDYKRESDGAIIPYAVKNPQGVTTSATDTYFNCS